MLKVLWFPFANLPFNTNPKPFNSFPKVVMRSGEASLAPIWNHAGASPAVRITVPKVVMSSAEASLAPVWNQASPNCWTSLRVFRKCLDLDVDRKREMERRPEARNETARGRLSTSKVACWVRVWFGEGVPKSDSRICASRYGIVGTHAVLGLGQFGANHGNRSSSFGHFRRSEWKVVQMRCAVFVLTP